MLGTWAMRGVLDALARCAALLVLSLTLALAAGTAHARSFQQQLAADPHGEVDVSNVTGEIEITGWNEPQVAIRAQLASDEQRVEVASDHGRISIRVTGNAHSWFGGGVRLELHVPRGSELDVSAVSANISSHGVAGAQHLHSVSGNINADLVSGDDEVRSVSGDIRLHGSGKPGHLHVTSVSGDVNLTAMAGDLEARTISGDLSARLSPAQRVRLSTTSGELRFDGRFERGGSLEAATVSGGVRIQAGAQAGYDYEVRTFSGDIDDCFGKQAERTSAFGPGKRLDGTWGAGAGHVRIRTLSGDVSLCDH